jgi:hypothetical protein
MQRRINLPGGGRLAGMAEGSRCGDDQSLISQDFLGGANAILPGGVDPTGDSAIASGNMSFQEEAPSQFGGSPVPL